MRTLLIRNHLAVVAASPEGFRFSPTEATPELVLERIAQKRIGDEAGRMKAKTESGAMQELSILLGAEKRMS